MYLGAGAPATHHGMHAFRGLAESFQPGKPANWTDAAYDEAG
jgi:hypothetical protein